MKKKITFIDVIIIAVVLIVALFVLSKVMGSDKKAAKTITYTVMATSQYPEVADNIIPADNVLLDAAGNTYGKVIGVDVKPSEDYYIDMKNEVYVPGSTEERKDVFVTVEAIVEDSDSGFKLGEKYIRIGEFQNITADTYSLSGYIVEIYE